MTIVIKTGFFEGVPRDIIRSSIELTSESLVEDASEKYSDTYGFFTKIENTQDEVYAIVKFFPYTYEFLWTFEKIKGGEYRVTLIGKTPGHFWEGFLDVASKLEGLVDTQWAAITNFAAGYLTAKSQGTQKHHLKKIHENVRKTHKKSVHKKHK